MIEKDIIFVDDNTEAEAIILAEEEVGISIIDKHDREVYYLCQRGPLDPEFRHYDGALEEWAITWEFAAAAMESGVFDDDELVAKSSGVIPGWIQTGGAGPDACSFSR
jgi:hypothetical protein